jgi:hypothetical protein
MSLCDTLKYRICKQPICVNCRNPGGTWFTENGTYCFFCHCAAFKSILRPCPCKGGFSIIKTDTILTCSYCHKTFINTTLYTEQFLDPYCGDCTIQNEK